MNPPLTEVLAAHRQLLATIEHLTDSQVGEPSRLPGWTRGHVLAHLTDAARARARVINHALRGEQVSLWEQGERDAIIEATAGRGAHQHREAFAASAADLVNAWLSVVDWNAYTGTVYTRWREVMIHLVDLDIGVEPVAWNVPFAVHVIDMFSQRLPSGYAVHASDLDRSWGSGSIISATSSDLAGWLVGRPSPIAGPALGAWPTY